MDHEARHGRLEWYCRWDHGGREESYKQMDLRVSDTEAVGWRQMCRS